MQSVQQDKLIVNLVGCHSIFLVPNNTDGGIKVMILS